MSLAERLATRIRETGPISVAEYMTLCLLDPVDGYYPTRDPIGAGADFITAPEVSQMFGEMIGIWVAQVWAAMGEPDTLNLAEAGPGKGTMMADTLRVLSKVRGLNTALELHLIEASAALMAVQAQTLAPYPQAAHWCDAIAKTGTGPLVLLGNEYLDCLPVRQFIFHRGRWHERMVGLDEAGAFIFSIAATPLPQTDVQLWLSHVGEPHEDMLVEVRPGVHTLVQELADRAEQVPMAALFIDYGPARFEPGDTLQAVSAHEKVSPLSRPGEVDMTARVDFSEISRLAKAQGLQVLGPVTQAGFLAQMGLMQRAAALTSARPDQRGKIARQLHRLTDAQEMGDLFKVIAVTSPGLSGLPGFAA